MEIAPTTHYKNLKRYWRIRKKYQRLNGDNRKKVRVARLGDGPNGSTSIPTRRFWKIRSTSSKLRLIKYVSPIKLLSKLQGTYVDMMVKMAGNITGGRGAKRIAGGSKKANDQISAEASCGSEAINNRLVLEIYKSLAATRPH